MSTNNRSRGRSPELQQLLDEAAVAPMLPVQRMLPEQRGVRPARPRDDAVPAQRPSADAGRAVGQPAGTDSQSAGTDGQSVRTDGEASPADDPEPYRAPRRILRLWSPDLPRRRSSPGRHTPRPLRLRVVTEHVARRPSRAASAPVVSKLAVVRVAGGQTTSVTRSPGASHQRTRRTLNLHTLNVRTIRYQSADPDSSWRPEPHEVPQPVAVVVPAPVAAETSAPPSYPILVARAAILAAADSQAGAAHLPRQRSSRRRAVVLAGGVAAAVIAIMAVVVFAVGQRSGTSPGAEGAGSGANTSTPAVNTPSATAAAAVGTGKTSAKAPAKNRPVAPAAASTPPTAAPQPAGIARTTPATGTLTSSQVEATSAPKETPTAAPTQPAEPAGDGGTATVVTGISKLTGWVVIGTTPNP